jgi:hypothetical protein
LRSEYELDGGAGGEACGSFQAERTQERK